MNAKPPAATVRWSVDRRPPTLWTRLYRAGMWARRDKEAFEGAEHTLAVARDRQASGDAAPGRLTRVTRTVTRTELAGMTTWVVAPRRRPPVARVVYVHGGGYVHPLTPDYWRLVRSLTGSRSGPAAEVVLPAYPLAPDADVDEVLPRLLELYDVVAAATPVLPVVLMGDSAGGALVLVMAGQLRDRGASPGPAAVVMLSPWLDATLEDARVRALEPSDPMLAESGLREAGRRWAGSRGPDDPLVSPVQADLSGLPPLDLFVGEHDILRPAVDSLVAHARRDGADLHVHESAAMFHVWMTRAIPEAARTRHELRQLVALRAAG